ncbi:MAG: hypothetical protein KC777_01075 [Cyanobacteria bacterium HKST-UBA02]|nr:hypothetical protein [Cyanobacteria bacterium HKST-UBA02]
MRTSDGTGETSAGDREQGKLESHARLLADSGFQPPSEAYVINLPGGPTTLKELGSGSGPAVVEPAFARQAPEKCQSRRTSLSFSILGKSFSLFEGGTLDSTCGLAYLARETCDLAAQISASGATGVEDFMRASSRSLELSRLCVRTMDLTARDKLERDHRRALEEKYARKSPECLTSSEMMIRNMLQCDI